MQMWLVELLAIILIVGVPFAVGAHYNAWLMRQGDKQAYLFAGLMGTAATIAGIMSLYAYRLVDRDFGFILIGSLILLFGLSMLVGYFQCPKYPLRRCNPEDMRAYWRYTVAPIKRMFDLRIRALIRIE